MTDKTDNSNEELTEELVHKIHVAPKEPVAAKNVDSVLDVAVSNGPTPVAITAPTLPDGLEVIDLIENLPYNLACAMQHIYSAQNTLHKVENINTAQWYLDRELQRMKNYGEYS